MSTLTEAAATRHTEAELREALQRIHHVAIGKSDRAYMSIPADPRHDADLVLSAAIDELVELRAKGVDATLDVTAELARVTAELATLKVETSDLSRLVARQADLLTAAVNALKGEPPELVLWSHHDVGELAAAMRARAERAEAERGELRARLTGEPTEEQWDYAANAQRQHDRAEKAEKANATLRGLAERARKHLTEATHGEDCSRSDECDDADPGECGNHDPGYCPACDCGVSEWHETAAELYAALKETT